MKRAALSLLMFGCLAQAQQQNLYNFQKVPVGDPYCPREEIDAQKRLEAQQGLNTRTMRDQWMAVDKAVVLPPAERTDAGGFAVEPVSGSKRLMSELKGKVVVIGFIAAICEPSIRLLGELAELQAKGPQFGFEALPVSLDSATVIGEITRRNRPRFDKTTFYSPGLGKEGPLNLGPELQGLPTVVILDRQGRVAVRWVGFTPGMLVKALKMVLTEPAGTPAPTPPAPGTSPVPPPPAQPKPAPAVPPEPAKP